MSDEELIAEIRDGHARQDRREGEPPMCIACSPVDWPCDAVRAADALEAATRERAAVPDAQDERVSMEVLNEYRRLAAWLESQAALRGATGDTMHGLAAEALATLIDHEYSRHTIPLYGMLDVWVALYGTSHPEFDEFYDEHGYAEAWSRLMAEIRSRAAVPDAAPDGQVIIPIARIHELRAAKDAALAAIERVRKYADERSVYAKTRNNIVGSWRIASDLYDLLGVSHEEQAALDGAPEPEDVWEYGYELIEPDDRNVFDRDGDYVSAAFAYRAARKRIHEERHPDVPNLQYAIVRRRKAGPWLPVEGEKESENE